MAFDDRPRGRKLQLLIHGASTLRWIELNRPSFVVGRSPDCEIVLSDPSVSRRHLALELVDDELRFRELSGTNPIRLDGVRCAEGVLQVGSRLLIGLTQIELHESSDIPAVGFIDDYSSSTVIVDTREADHATSTTPDPRLPGITVIADVMKRLTAQDSDAHTFANALLHELVNLTSRQAGIVGTIEDGALQVLASRCDPSQALLIPRSALDPFPDTVPGIVILGDSKEEERLVLPLPGDPRRLVVLGRPTRTAPPASSTLPLARSVIDAAAAIHVLRLRSDDAAREVQRLRFARTHAYRSIVASMRLADARRKLSEAARLELPVRIFGEEGTEKAELANFLHAESAVAGGPFVECYVRLLPQQRTKETMFGAEPEVHERSGKCLARARAGTIYVHEPELLIPELQDRLADALEHSLTADDAIRFVLGHGCDQCEAAELEFTPRLALALESAVTVRIPPLRDRDYDIEALTDTVLAELGPGPSGQPRTIDAATRSALLAYGWPGNAAQHRRVIERAAMRAGDRPIAVTDLEEQVRDPQGMRRSVRTLAEVSIDHIYGVIEMCGGNKRRAAEALDIASSTLYEWIKRHPKKFADNEPE